MVAANTGGDGTEDHGLVLAAKAGDRAALEALLRRHQDRIHAVCRRVTGSEDDALDATQEALIAIVRGLGRFDGRSAFSTWVYRVATNAALDELRRRRRRPLPGSAAGDETTRDDGPGARCPAAGSTPDHAEAVGARFDVDAALASLPGDQRAAVVLRDLLDLDYAEIAEVLDIPIGTVRSRIARGRAAIAGAMRDAPRNRAPLAGRPITGTSRPTP